VVKLLRKCDDVVHPQYYERPVTKDGRPSTVLSLAIAMGLLPLDLAALLNMATTRYAPSRLSPGLVSSEASIATALYSYCICF
jgi:hypothetical protein